MIGGTKEAELQRSAELYNELCHTEGTYYGLALLYDSQHTIAEIGRILEILRERKIGMD